MGNQFLIPVLWNLCSESVGEKSFEILVEHSTTGSLSSITVRMEYSETSLPQTPSGPQNSVHYREVFATQRFFLNYFKNLL